VAGPDIGQAPSVDTGQRSRTGRALGAGHGADSRQGCLMPVAAARALVREFDRMAEKNRGAELPQRVPGAVRAGPVSPLEPPSLPPPQPTTLSPPTPRSPPMRTAAPASRPGLIESGPGLTSDNP